MDPWDWEQNMMKAILFVDGGTTHFGMWLSKKQHNRREGIDGTPSEIQIKRLRTYKEEYLWQKY